MHQAMVPEEKEYLLYWEAISHATRLDGLVLITINGMTKTHYEYLLGKNPRFVENMRTWGEAGVVKEPKSWKSKLGKHGRKAMFVGYALNRLSDTLRM